MPTQSDYNSFRRLIGDYNEEQVDDDVIDSYLDDAVQEVTADFGIPVTDFDVLVRQYQPEVIVWAAINFWWSRAGEYVDRHSQSVGQASHQASEKWDRAMEMIRQLREHYNSIQTLGTDITFGNISRWSKTTMTRIGGVREEDALG